MVKDQIHYASLEEVSKSIYKKQFATVITNKNVWKYYNEKCTCNTITHWNLLYALKMWNCLNFIQKRILIIFFFLIKLLFIRISCLFCLIQFIDSNEGVEKFFNKREHQKRMCKNKGLRHLCILSIEVSRKLYAKAVCFLIALWLQKEF